MTKQDRDKLLEKIAKKTLGIATLETRKGGVDFYEGDGGCVAVWNLKKAFQKAFNAGIGEGFKLSETDITTNDWSAAVDLKNNAIIYVHDDESCIANVLENCIISRKKSIWLNNHPKYEEANIPDRITNSFKKQFVIVKCRVIINQNQIPKQK